MNDTPPPSRSMNTNKLLTPLQNSIPGLNKPHHISGMLQLPSSSFSLFFRVTKDHDGHASRCIDLANATFNELEQLARASRSASLRVVEQDTTNELRCDVGKLGPECFTPRLAPDQTNLVKLIEDYLFEFEVNQSKIKIKIELRELNVYTQGSFSKPRIETPRGKNMIGSLVIVFPTPHEGGALLARHPGHSQEWSFDPSSSSTACRTKISYVVLPNDVEHEVTPVTSGHRVTLTYDLYRDVDAYAQNLAEDPFSVPNHGRAFRESFEALLDNPEFFPYGGTLAFGLRHSYPIKRGIRHVYDLLKANDAMVYRILRTLGFQPALYLYHEWNDTPWCLEDNTIEGGLIDHVVEFVDFSWEEPGEVDVTREILIERGQVVCGNDLYRLQEHAHKKAETMEWVTPMTKFSTKESKYTTYGNEPIEHIAYWDLCLVVRIGKASERLMYPTLSQLKRERVRNSSLIRSSPFWDRMNDN